MLNGLGAVILAGGKSSRMGRDKTFLELDGRTLLARQIELLRAAGLREILIAGRTEVDYASGGCPVLVDRFAGAGPLAGIEAALNATANPLLLVLAVDMPHMSARLLGQLAAHCTATTGAIPRVDGAIEPLAAIYPKTAAAIVTELLNELPSPTLNCSSRRKEAPTSPPEFQMEPPYVGCYEVQGGGAHPKKSPSATTFATRCIAAGLAAFVDLPATDARHFANWNSPADLHG